MSLLALVAVNSLWLAHTSLTCTHDGLHEAVCMCVFYQFYLFPSSMTFVTGSRPALIQGSPSEPRFNHNWRDSF